MESLAPAHGGKPLIHGIDLAPIPQPSIQPCQNSRATAATNG